MRSNRLDRVFGFTCFGESHGPAMGLVIEDILPGTDFPYSELNHLLSLRKPNQTAYSSSRNESDEYQIVSGVMDGKTTGTPICLLFRNNDISSADYEALKDIFRPGHADYAWYQKFKIYDYRGGGRASGRETISRVAASAMVVKLLGDIRIEFQTIRIGLLTSAENSDFTIVSKDNPFCWNDRETIDDLYQYLDSIKATNDTVGGVVKIRIENVPAGLGDPVFEKLSAGLAQGIMSIGSIKGITIGDGFALGLMQGTEANDQMDATGYLTNHSGGILGGISNGQPVIMTVVVKPVPSHGKQQMSIDKAGNPVSLQINGRHDVCHIPRLLPVIEAMIRLVLSDAIAHQKLVSGAEATMNDYREALDKLDEDLLLTLFKRRAIVNLVKDYKIKKNLSFRDSEREQKLTERWLEIATELGLDNDIILELLDKILELSRK